MRPAPKPREPMHLDPVRRRLLASIALGSLAPATRSDPALPAQTLRCFPNGPIFEYRWRLLELALSARAVSRPYRLVPYPEDLSQSRGLSLLESGAIDVVALGTNADREARFRPIPIDILRGMVGFRLLIIRKSDEERFARMDDEQFRREVVFGLNSQWADLPVLRGNGYKVETSIGYESLFAMLQAGRIDAFPRGLNEASRELALRPDLAADLTIDRTRAFYFPYPVYYWVRKNADALAGDIDRGLSARLKDGSFRRFFERYYAKEIAEMKTNNRRVIEVRTSILPSRDPRVDTSWWWPRQGKGS